MGLSSKLDVQAPHIEYPLYVIPTHGPGRIYRSDKRLGAPQVDSM